MRRSLPSRTALLDDLQRALIPPDPHDNSNIFLEVRAGTGGDEAAIFAGDLLRMYTRYAESQGWQIEIVSRATASTAATRKLSAGSAAPAYLPA